MPKHANIAITELSFDEAEEAGLDGTLRSGEGIPVRMTVSVGSYEYSKVGMLVSFEVPSLEQATT